MVPFLVWIKDRKMEEEKADKETEITCPICITTFLVSPEDNAIICSNLDCRAVLQTPSYRNMVLFKGKVKVHPHSRNTEVADCYVTAEKFVLETKKPLQIPLENVEECYHVLLLEYLGRTRRVTLKYRDAIEKRQKIEFNIRGQEAPLLTHRVLKIPWFVRLKVLTDTGFQRSSIEDTQFMEPEQISEKKSLRNSLKVFFDIKDRTVERIYTGLLELGIDAQIYTGGLATEEDIHFWQPFLSDSRMTTGRPLGFIDINKGPIRWVTIRNETHGAPVSSSRPTYYTEYGVPDPRLTDEVCEQRNGLLHNIRRALLTFLGLELHLLKIRIKSTRVKSSPMPGQSIDVHWSGTDLNLGIIKRLNDDITIKGPLIESPQVRICAYGYYRCWIISIKTNKAPSSPSRELWDCYQKIAKHLLAEWKST
jgi:hypothetical protein